MDAVHSHYSYNAEITPPVQSQIYNLLSQLLIANKMKVSGLVKIACIIYSIILY